MEKMNEKEFMRWVIDNHADGCTLAEDWDACRDGMSGELEEGAENWKNPFIMNVVIWVRGIDGHWNAIKKFQKQDMGKKSCKAREFGKELNKLGIVWNWGIDKEVK